MTFPHILSAADAAYRVADHRLTPVAPTALWRTAETADALRRADGYLTTHGWARCQVMSASGRVCLLGAVAVSTPTRKAYWLAVSALFGYAAASDTVHLPSTGLMVSPLELWNDDPGRVQDDVHAFLGKTAAFVEEGL